MILPVKYIKSFLISLIVYFFVLFSPQVKAATLYLNPATGSVGPNFDVSVTVDTKDSSTIKSVVTYITYDPSQIEAQTIQNGVFDNYTAKEIDNVVGLITLKADVTTPPAPGKILQLGKISFSALKTRANTTINFSANPQNKSKILDIIGTDILTSTTGSTLLVNASTSTTGNVTSTTSSQTVIPTTGSFNPIIYLGLVIFVVSFSLLVRSYAVSKF